MEPNLLIRIANIIAPHLHNKHKSTLSLEIAEKVLEEVKQDTLNQLDQIIKPQS